jgi:oxygen-independent coproporphyrinogen-3 oxidase
VPSALPPGDPVPDTGPLTPQALIGSSERPLSIYLHVPFCATRCGYCDFNTYTSDELGTGGSRADFVEAAASEIRLARQTLGERDRLVSTVFVGGGTPTLLPAPELVRLLGVIRDEFGLTDEAEVTTESNPESVDIEALATLREGGFTRVSFGMQSAQPSVLQVLDRTHTPGRSLAAVRDARDAGFESINLDLIYGAPGETDDDWRASLDAVIEAEVDHVSAYALIVEPGTRLAGQVQRGEILAPEDDVLADRYERADDVLSASGLHWYEVSNWAMPGHECRHNLAYWTHADWWGIGPGAHSHVGGVRWWNSKHPATYARALREGRWPAAGREVLNADDRRVEALMLQVRLAAGLPDDGLAERTTLDTLVEEGLMTYSESGGRWVLTRKGRLLADAVVRRLL